MATGKPTNSNTDTRMISVNILSPSSEINSPLSFPSLPITTTVAELKHRIQDAVATRPTLERQRLIYRGKMLGSGSATMKDVFGPEALDDSAAKSLHLVLMPAPPQPTPKDGSIQSPQSENSLRHSPGEHASLRTAASSHPEFRHVVDQNPTRHQPNHRAYNNLPIPPGAFPPEVQAHLAIHNAAIAQALGQPAAPGSAPPLSFEQLIAQQQQQRASAGLPGLTGSTPVGGNSTNGNSDNTSASNQGTNLGSIPTNPAANTSVESSVTREMQGPNGEVVRITTVQGNINGLPFNGLPFPQINNGNSVFVQNPVTGHGPATVPTPNVPHQLPLGPGQGSTTSQQPPSTNAQQPSSTTIHQPSPIAWLLSDANGPHAILQAPSGLYTSPSAERHFHHFFHSVGVAPAQAFVPFPPGPPVSAPEPQPRNRNRANRTQNQQQQQQQQIQGMEARLAQFQQQHAHHQPPAQGPQVENNNNNQQRQVQANNPNNDLGRQLVPLAGHLWLLVRLIGFVWFFAAGASWRRIFILGTLALLVFLKQTGLLEGLQHAIWDPIRHHLEGLVPLDNRQQANNAHAPAEPARDGEGPAPDPRQTAERLIREREEINRGWVRRRLRAVERAVAIFVASLIPGVGERHIAAREAADAVRQVEERVRNEEQERREGEERPANAGTGAAAEGAGEGEAGAREGEGAALRELPPPQPFLGI
ncbi:MAG: hypothetical protein M1836_001733 [Candelina mexicana]|nr:MAG: hypothetical protein M1836_001733 [Candelina mexicana]